MTHIAPTETNEQDSLLTDNEHDELAACEQRIASGNVEAAKALKTIHDQRLYREEFSTWEKYVKKRWGYSRSYSLLLIAFAEIYEIIVADKTSANGRRLLPTGERQVRSLPKLGDPKKIRAAWSAAVKKAEDKLPSGVQVDKIVSEMMIKAHRYKSKKAPGIRLEIAGSDGGRRQTDTLYADNIEFISATDAIFQQNAQDAAQNEDAVADFIPDGATATEAGDADHTLQPVQEQDTQNDEDAVGGTAEDCEGEGEVEEAATTNDQPNQAQVSFNTPPLRKASGQASRAEELAEACRMAVANDVDENVAAAIFSAVRRIVEESLLLMAA